MQCATPGSLLHCPPRCRISGGYEAETTALAHVVPVSVVMCERRTPLCLPMQPRGWASALVGLPWVTEAPEQEWCRCLEAHSRRLLPLLLCSAGCPGGLITQPAGSPGRHPALSEVTVMERNPTRQVFRLNIKRRPLWRVPKWSGN